jgi:hypothetical protein
LYMPTVYLGIMVTEDFLWFAVQSAIGWRKPDALDQLFLGKMKWIKDWVDVPLLGIKLPRSYYKTPALVIILLVVQYILVHVF